MIRAVPLLNLIHPVLKRHQPAIRCRRQITEHQRISRHRLLCLELSGQLTLQAADPRLIDSARMMSDQPRQPVIRADPPQEPGAIQRMKSSLRQVRGIPDVMKPRRRRQQLTRQAKPDSNLLTTSTSTLNMPPPTRQHRIQITLRQNTRLSRRHHDPERTALNIHPRARPSELRCRIMPNSYLEVSRSTVLFSQVKPITDASVTGGLGWEFFTGERRWPPQASGKRRREVRVGAARAPIS
jgi:hypothetical protein